jgi:hypothetical protein
MFIKATCDSWDWFYVYDIESMSVQQVKLWDDGKLALRDDSQMIDCPVFDYNWFWKVDRSEIEKHPGYDHALWLKFKVRGEFKSALCSGVIYLCNENGETAETIRPAVW